MEKYESTVHAFVGQRDHVIVFLFFVLKEKEMAEAKALFEENKEREMQENAAKARAQELSRQQVITLIILITLKTLMTPTGHCQGPSHS